MLELAARPIVGARETCESADLSSSSSLYTSAESSPTSSPDCKTNTNNEEEVVSDSAADDADESSLVSFAEDNNNIPPKQKKVKFRLPHEEELSRCWDGRRQRMENMSAQYWAITGNSDRKENTLRRTNSDGNIINSTKKSSLSYVRHDFDVKEFEHLVTCQVCYQLIFGRALICQGCNLLCHMKCELKVLQPCNGSIPNAQTNREGLKIGQTQGALGTYQSIATSSTLNATTASESTKPILLNGIKSKRGKMDEIDIMFITERILVLTYPSGAGESQYRTSLEQISKMLRIKHDNKYKIFNVSKRRHDLCRLNPNVVEFGWPEELAPPLERLCALCKEMENWLTSDPSHTVVIHCKGGRSRPAILIAAYMHYTDICANDDQALERFAMRRFTDDYVKGIAQPSHKRYVTYFSGLLSGAIKINSSAIYLHSVSVIGLSQTDGTVCQPYVKIYERMSPVFTSGVYQGGDRLQVNLPSPVSLRGDVLLKCYNWKQSHSPLLFRCQFNTCALDLTADNRSVSTLIFTKPELDQAFHDSRLCDVTRLELVFSVDPIAPLPPAPPAVSPLHHQVPRSNSYENFETTSEDADEPTTADAMTARFPKPEDSLGGRDGMYASIKKDSRSPPLANESTDSGVSTASNHLHNANVDDEDELERPIIKVQAKRPTLETARDQLIKVFGKFSPERETYETDKTETITKKINEYPQNEVTMEASVKSGVKSPPATLPKPRRDSLENNSPYMDEKMSHRPPAVMPPSSKRGSSPSPHRPTTPHGEKTGLIDRELVGQDRYDPQSKAFSYVPVRALEDHFNSPKKQTRLVQRIESNEGEIMDETETDRWAVPDARTYVDESPAESIRGSQTETTPKIKGRKTKYSNYKILDSEEYNSDMDDLCDPDFYLTYSNGSKPTTTTRPSSSQLYGERMTLPATSGEAESSGVRTTAPSPPAPPVPPPPAPGSYTPPGTYAGKSTDHTYSTSNQQPTTIPKSYSNHQPYSNAPNQHQYSTAPTPIPYSTAPTPIPYSTAPTPIPYSSAPNPHQYPTAPTPQPSEHPPSVASSVRDLDGLADVFQSSSTPQPQSYESQKRTPRPSAPPSAWYGRTSRHDPVKSATSWDAYLDEDDYSFAPKKNMIGGPYSRSVTSTPLHYRSSGRQSVSADRHSLSSMGDFDADEWLELQLEKLRMKKEVNDPDVVRRRNQEKLLLDELKHIHEDRMAARGKNEADYTTEGYGTKMVDPLDEWQREQERLANTQSPYPLGSYSISTPATPVVTHRRNMMGRQSSLDLGYDVRARAPVVTGKPPTPPPRERSRTPPSPRRMSPVRSPPRRPTPPPELPPPSAYRATAPRPQPGGNSFDHLESLVWNDQPRRHANARSESAMAHQSPKSILKKPKHELLLQRYSNSSLALTPQSSEPVTRESNLRQNYNTYSQSDSQFGDRSETPSFPVRGMETPLPYHPLLYDGAEYDPRSPGQPRTPLTHRDRDRDRERPSTTPIYAMRSPSPTSQAYYGQSHRSSITSLEPMEVIHHHPVFVKDTSKYWYKPTISREDAINILKDKPPGTFIVRDSNSFPGAFGLALKVATPPPGVHTKSNDGTELVRHFLIEPTSKGVKLKGCNNEPVFGTLSALVYQHSITPLALPSKLLLPEFDPAVANDQLNSTSAILEQGAACNVTYIHSCDTESLTGPEAVRRAVEQAFTLLSQRQLQPVSVHFKASGQGITVTDNTRKRFFRRHYPVVSVGFCSLDPEDRRWTEPATEGAPLGPVIQQARIFGFVARKISSRTDNACHIFAELEPEQPATAIVNFVSKVMMGSVSHNK